jgi:hypothetical protein
MEPAVSLFIGRFGQSGFLAAISVSARQIHAKLFGFTESLAYEGMRWLAQEYLTWLFQKHSRQAYPFRYGIADKS